MIEHRATCAWHRDDPCDCLPDDEVYGIWIAADFRQPTRYGLWLLVAAMVIFVILVTSSVVSYLCGSMEPW